MPLCQELHDALADMATPGCFASRVSQGRWRLVPHIDAIDRAIMDTVRGRTAPILVIEAPPRHGKSELISRYLPAWFLGRFPEKRVMLAAHGAGFARQWGRKARELLEEHGPKLFGVEVRNDLRSASEWGLVGHEGGMVTSGVGGPMTGRGADLLIIDDPIKNSQQSGSEVILDSLWDWWQSTASTRLEPGGCVILIATRWNVADLSGRLIRAAESGNGHPVRRVRLPALAEEDDLLGRSVGTALWPERYSVKRLEQQQQALNPAWWQALYQQQPAAANDLEWEECYFGPELWPDHWPDLFETAVVAIDPSIGEAKKGDYSAIVFAGYSGGLVWVDASIERRTAERIVADAIGLCDVWRPQLIGFEANNSQSLLGLEFDRQCRERNRPPLPLVPIHNYVGKKFRIRELGPLVIRNRLRFVANDHCRLLVRQLREFPLGRYDDGPDALEMAVRMLHYHDPRPVPAGGDELGVARSW
ncbi:MAG: hypothetical protein EXS05_18075 [Planctomycetaceae bacterium]|nr:hypothetical protein [Planctomycetaceae bacterium]